MLVLIDGIHEIIPSNPFAFRGKYRKYKKEPGALPPELAQKAISDYNCYDYVEIQKTFFTAPAAAGASFLYGKT